MTNQALEEYKKDSANIEKDRIILKEFYKAVKIQDKNKAEEQIKKIKELPFLTYKKDICVHTEDGMTILGYQSRPWKARDLDRKELKITETNEEMHPYLAEFFDIAVRENMTKMDGMLDNFKNYDFQHFARNDECLYDGNWEICKWLNKYAKTAVLFEQQGKKVVEPQTLQEYPSLKEYVELRMEQAEEEIFDTLAKEFIEGKDKEGDRKRIQILADTLLKYTDNSIKYEKYSKILGQYHIDAEVYNRHDALKIKGLRSIIEKERSTSINAAEDIKNLTDEQRKQNFAAKKKLMEEHPIMLEPCLNSMCESYVYTKDEAIKKEMLGELYVIRKGGKSDTEKRDMAKTFKRVLDKNPSLKKDENLVALSKIDTIISQPTKSVKKQVTR